MTTATATESFANIMYILIKELQPEAIEEVFEKLSLIFEFVGFTSSVLEKVAAFTPSELLARI